jgi:hypothetical protein
MQVAQSSTYCLTRIILRPLSALSLDEVNIAKRNITTELFGLHTALFQDSVLFISHKTTVETVVRRIYQFDIHINTYKYT